MATQRILAGIFILAGVTTMAMATWISPWNNPHENDSTCGVEPCARACRICCSHFNHDGDDNAACRNAHCVGLPANCPSPKIAPSPIPE